MARRKIGATEGKGEGKGNWEKDYESFGHVISSPAILQPSPFSHTPHECYCILQSYVVRLPIEFSEQS